MDIHHALNYYDGQHDKYYQEYHEHPGIDWFVQHPKLKLIQSQEPVPDAIAYNPSTGQFTTAITFNSYTCRIITYGGDNE